MLIHKVLIADDDRDHLLMVALMLRKAGYEVISAGSAKAALQLAVEQDPDLLLLDIHMGDEDGYAVQEGLRKLDELNDKPIIYITGDKSNWVRCITNALGARAVLCKPFDREELLSTIKAILSTMEHAVAAPAGNAEHAPAQQAG